MKKAQKFLSFFLCCALLSARFDARAEESPAEDAVDAQITKVEPEGSAQIFYHDQDHKGVTAEAGMPLEAGDRVETGPDGHVEIGLSGDSMIELGPNTKFTVTSLKNSWTEFSLKAGLMFAKLQNLFKKKGRLLVKTPTAVASVRGTEFGVEYGDTGATDVAVFDEGEVVVEGGEGGAQSVVLAPNQETSVVLGRGPEKPRAMERFLRHRARVHVIRKRMLGMRRTWRAVPPGKRREIRQRTFERRLRIHRQINERRRKFKENRPEKRGR